MITDLSLPSLIVGRLPQERDEANGVRPSPSMLSETAGWSDIGTVLDADGGPMDGAAAAATFWNRVSSETPSAGAQERTDPRRGDRNTDLGDGTDEHVPFAGMNRLLRSADPTTFALSPSGRGVSGQSWLRLARPLSTEASAQPWFGTAFDTTRASPWDTTMHPLPSLDEANQPESKPDPFSSFTQAQVAPDNSGRLIGQGGSIQHADAASGEPFGGLSRPSAGEALISQFEYRQADRDFRRGNIGNTFEVGPYRFVTRTSPGAATLNDGIAITVTSPTYGYDPNTGAFATFEASPSNPLTFIEQNGRVSIRRR